MGQDIKGKLVNNCQMGTERFNSPMETSMKDSSKSAICKDEENILIKMVLCIVECFLRIKNKATEQKNIQMEIFFKALSNQMPNKEVCTNSMKKKNTTELFMIIKNQVLGL